jgi:hypothetical protein
MGIARESFYLLAQLNSLVSFENKSVLQLGKQSGIVSKRQIIQISKIFDLKFDFNQTGEYDFYKNYPTGDQIFQNLGFKAIDSIDITDYEGANIVHDLNTPIPESFKVGYDLVFDGGTTEHLFDQLAALGNIHKLLKVGGVVVHATPANNYLDHGYFQPQPSFYYEYYIANGYEVIQSYLIEANRNFYQRRRVYEYKPLMYEHLSFGGWGDKLIGNWFAFRKLETSTTGVIPQQQRYTDYLHVYNKPQAGTSRNYALLKNFFNEHPALKYYILQTKHWIVKFLRFQNYFFKPKRPKPKFFT